jgi:hypothetical protein
MCKYIVVHGTASFSNKLLPRSEQRNRIFRLRGWPVRLFNCTLSRLTAILMYTEGWRIRF